MIKHWPNKYFSVLNTRESGTKIVRPRPPDGYVTPQHLPRPFLDSSPSLRNPRGAFSYSNVMMRGGEQRGWKTPAVRALSSAKAGGARTFTNESNTFAFLIWLF